MLLISGGEFLMGTDNPGIPADGEGPQRPVRVDSFYMDIHEVTNKQFQSFVNATGYITEVGHLAFQTFNLNSLVAIIVERFRPEVLNLCHFFMYEAEMQSIE